VCLVTHHPGYSGERYAVATGGFPARLA
jgi:hypothetical protein